MKQILWHEPAKYRRRKYKEKEEKYPLESVKFALFAFVLILALRGLSGIHPAPDAHPPEWGLTAGIAIGVAVFAAYILPRFIGLMANSIVILSNKGVNNNIVGRGMTIRFWAWDKISYGYIWTEKLYDEYYPVISFCDADERLLVTLGLDKNADMHEIEMVLKENGKTLRYE